MNAYTISKLAADASVSVHIIRDYELRGLLSPCQSTKNGYRIYNKQSLHRLEFIITGKQAGISLCDLTNLCRAIDNNNANNIDIHLEHIHIQLVEKINIQRSFKRQLRKIKLLK